MTGLRLTLLGLVSAVCLLAAAAPAGAATVVINGGPVTEGSGNMIDEARAVGPFTRVVVAGPIDVQFNRTGAEKVMVHADDNVARLIDVRVDRGQLRIEVKKDASFRTRSKIFVSAEFKQIDGVRLDGSGDVMIDELKAGIFEGTIHGSGNLNIEKLEADTIAVSIAGSGDFTAGGRAAKAGFVIEGSGDVKAESLQAKAVAVRISGSGDAVVCASETLQVRIAGSGDVRYCGSPRVEKRVDGSGEVKPLR